MTEILPLAEALLKALIDIEDHATAVARAGCCQCSELDPGTERNYPFVRFTTDKAVGRPPNQIEWEMAHQEGCPMFGQKGVGRTTYG